MRRNPHCTGAGLEDVFGFPRTTRKASRNPHCTGAGLEGSSLNAILMENGKSQSSLYWSRVGRRRFAVSRRELRYRSQSSLYWSRVGRIALRFVVANALRVAILIVLEQGWKAFGAFGAFGRPRVAILIVLEQGWKNSIFKAWASEPTCRNPHCTGAGLEACSFRTSTASGARSQSSLYWSRVGSQP